MKINRVNSTEEAARFSDNQRPINKTPKGLPEVFKDTQAPYESKEVGAPPVLERATSWLPFSEVKTPEIPRVSKTGETLKPLDPTPKLEIPEDFNLNDDDKTISPFNYGIHEKPLAQMSDAKIREGLALMSSLSMDQVAAIVLKAQLEVEKDRAITAHDSFTKLNELRKIHQKTIQEVKDVLMKDQKTAGYFQTVESVARAASIACALVTAAVTGGWTVPAAIATAAKAAVVIASLTTAASSIGGTYYTERKVNKHKATLTASEHKETVFEGKITSRSEEMTSIADSDSTFSQQLLNLASMHQKLSQAIMQKN